MANKREFKKYVSNLSSSICQDMMTAYYNIENIDVNGIDNAIIKVLEATEVAILNSNVKFDKNQSAFENAHQYNKEKQSFYKSLFNRIHKDYLNTIKEAIHIFNESIPQATKDSNK